MCWIGRHETAEEHAFSPGLDKTNVLKGKQGFSLIEMVAVIGIIAILAAALFPVLIRRIDIATRKQESANLMAISNALAFVTLQNGAAPAASAWSNAVATASVFPVSRAAANSRRFARHYFAESSVSGMTNGAPSRPPHARAILLSTLGGVSINPSVVSDDTQFAYLWDTQDGSLPPGGNLASWNGTGDDLLVQRVDYAPLFHRLVLVNRDTNNAFYRINEVTAPPLTNSGPPNLGTNAFYVNGTVISLCNSAGNPMTSLVLTRDIGFVFEDGVWRDQIAGGSLSSTLPDDFAAKAAVFLAVPRNSEATKGSDQQAILSAMYSYMYSYTLWANQRPHFPMHQAPSDIQVPEYVMLNDIAANGGFLDAIGYTLFESKK